MASNPNDGGGGHGLNFDLDKPPIETLTEKGNLSSADLVKDAILGEKDATLGGKHVILGEKDGSVRYYFPLQEGKAGFAVDDLVWGKIKSHPWWPGQIFDSKYASDMALKIQKKDHMLVAYFGDKSFAWCNESQLKPFQEGFSEMEKQSNLEPFAGAVRGVLDEVSRRVELGMACQCLNDVVYADLKYRKVENAGVREGTCSASVDKSMIVNAFQPESLLGYIYAFARCPFGGFDRLELAIATAQMKAFYRSKGQRELAVYVANGRLVEIDGDVPVSKRTVSQKGKADVSTPATESGKKRRGRPRKNPVSEDGSEEDADYQAKFVSRASKSEKVKAAKSTSAASNVTSGNGKKPRGRPRKSEEEQIDQSVSGDKSGSQAKSILRSSKSIKSEKPKAVKLNVGSNISSGTGKKPRGRPRKYPRLEVDTVQKSISDEFEVGEVDLSSDDESEYEEEPAQASAKKSRVDLDSDYVGPSKKRTPYKKVGSKSPSATRTRSARIGDRISRVASQMNESPKILNSNDETAKGSVSKRKRRTDEASADNSSRAVKKFAAEDYSSPSELLSQLCLVAGDPLEEYSFLSMLTSFFADYRNSLSSNSFEVYEPLKLKRKIGRKKKAVDSSSEMSEPDYMLDSYWSDIVLHSSPERAPASKGRKRKVGSEKKGRHKKAKAGEDPVNTPNPDNAQEVEGEGIMGKETPTALILSFNESDALPSTSDLVKIFSDFGPLRDEETEVLRKTSRAKVVFKFRDDAEKAFSSAGKYSVFGPALVSYRLRHSPSPANSPRDGSDASPTTDG